MSNNSSKEANRNSVIKKIIPNSFQTLATGLFIPVPIARTPSDYLSINTFNLPFSVCFW
jgi:hypothetical protein